MYAGTFHLCPHVHAYCRWNLGGECCLATLCHVSHLRHAIHAIVAMLGWGCHGERKAPAFTCAQLQYLHTESRTPVQINPYLQGKTSGHIWEAQSVGISAKRNQCGQASSGPRDGHKSLHVSAPCMMVSAPMHVTVQYAYLWIVSQYTTHTH